MYGQGLTWQQPRTYRDRDLTLVQNYKRLGLTSRIGNATGGVEKKVSRDGESDGGDALEIRGSKTKPTTLIPGEVRVEREPETGRILRVIRPESKSTSDSRTRRRLDDPLNSFSSSSSSSEEEEEEVETEDPTTTNHPPATSTTTTSVVAALEAQASAEAAQLARKKRPRQQSKREAEWIAALVRRYGDDVRAMARDQRLNPMQQTERDIGRRVGRWRASGGREEGADVDVEVGGSLSSI